MNMVKTVNTIAPTPEIAATDIPAKVVDIGLHLSNRAGKPSLLASLTKDTKGKLTGKAQLMQETGKLLQDAHKLYSEGDKEAVKAAEKAGSAGFMLYQGLANGTVSLAEVSDQLGKEFGFRQRKGPNGSMVDGKTPDGPGKVIRDRVARLVSAAEYATGGEGVAFFDNLPVDEVQPVVNRLDAGEISIWTAYGELGDIAKAHREPRQDVTFDALKIAAIADKLLQSPEASTKAFVTNPTLVIAYGRLCQAFDLIDEAAGVAAQKAAQAVK